MAVKREEQPQPKLHLKRAKGKITKEYVEQCRALKERILRDRGGVPLPDSTPILRAMREGKLR